VLQVCNIWYIVYLMVLPDIGRYRRRFIVEFGPEDSGLVDRMGQVHRTKRAAIIAGLRLLDSGLIEQLKARVSALEADLSTANAASEERTQVVLDAKLAAAQADANLPGKRAELAAARAEVRRVKAANADVRRAIVELTAERDRLSDLVPHHAYCGYCDKAVPEAEWAEQPAERGFWVYHKPDGYRPKGSLVGGGASLLFWREKGLPPSTEGGRQ
jgi:hypothetical protein